MEFTAPVSNGYTVYGKSDCSYCEKVKVLLSEFDEVFTYLNCDDYLISDKTAFLQFIEKLAGKEYKTFPMVFYSGEFIGGYTDTFKKLIETHNE
jgi:glutaredoxin